LKHVTRIEILKKKTFTKKQGKISFVSESSYHQGQLNSLSL